MTFGAQPDEFTGPNDLKFQRQGSPLEAQIGWVVEGLHKTTSWHFLKHKPKPKPGAHSDIGDLISWFIMPASNTRMNRIHYSVKKLLLRRAFGVASRPGFDGISVALLSPLVLCCRPQNASALNPAEWSGCRLRKRPGVARHHLATTTR
jgi:hypothetical protein